MRAMRSVPQVASGFAFPPFTTHASRPIAHAAATVWAAVMEATKDIEG